MDRPLGDHLETKKMTKILKLILGKCGVSFEGNEPAQNHIEW
jgi:hypothetical protein